MTSDQAALQHVGDTSAPRSWRVDLARLARNAWEVLCAPPFPWATLSEVNILLRLIAGAGESDTHPPDPFSTEAPFLNDSWPRE